MHYDSENWSENWDRDPVIAGELLGLLGTEARHVDKFQTMMDDVQYIYLSERDQASLEGFLRLARDRVAQAANDHAEHQKAFIREDGTSDEMANGGAGVGDVEAPYVEESASAQGSEKCTDAHADRQFNDDLMIAVRDSKAVPAPLNVDGVVLYQLTRKAMYPEVDAILFDADGPLASLHSRVLIAGCEVNPTWSPLKALFVPCTEQQILELTGLGYDLMNTHMLALCTDEGLIDKALRAEIPKKHRPKLKSVAPLEGLQIDADGSEEEDAGPMLRVDYAFSTDSSIGFPRRSSEVNS
jgi:hypothetical protein